MPESGGGGRSEVRMMRMLRLESEPGDAFDCLSEH